MCEIEGNKLDNEDWNINMLSLYCLRDRFFFEYIKIVLDKKIKLDIRGGIVISPLLHFW